MNAELQTVHDIGMFLSDGEVIVTSRKIAQLTGMQHKDLIRKIRKVCDLTAEINGRNFAPVEFEPVEAEYIDEKGESRIEYHLTIDEAILLQSTFSAERSLVTVNVLLRHRRQLLRLVASKNQELAAIATRYLLTDSEDCHNMSTFCSRFDLTPARAYKILVEAKVLKRVQNNWGKIVYRPHAQWLGRGIFNIEQSTDDLKTHLKFTAKEGVNFLTEWFGAWKLEQEAGRRKAALLKHPVIPGLEMVFADILEGI